MISDARGGHVSPGTYSEEKDVTYSVKSLGITSLGLVGETLKGPAFQPIDIKDWSEYIDYFGSTSTEKYKGNGYPKYELPYIAKSYLKKSKQLSVCRVLGISGYNAGKAWVIYGGNGNDTFPIAVLRSKKKYTDGMDGCEGKKIGNDSISDIVTNITMSQYEGVMYYGSCEMSATPVTYEQKAILSNSGTTFDLGHFKLEITTNEENSKTYKYNVSLNSDEECYIYNIFGIDPIEGNEPVYIESVFDKSLVNKLIEKYNNCPTQDAEISLSITGYDKSSTTTSGQTVINYDYTDYKEPYRCAITPWVVSEVKGNNKEQANLKKLFRFYTISDGNSANFQVKISIEKIRPDSGLFNVLVRDYYDTDANPVVLEKYVDCSLVEGEKSYLGLKMGTYDGEYITKSKFVTVEFSNAEGIEKCIPCGFIGYPVPMYQQKKGIYMSYNRSIDARIKPKRQYFGLNKEYLDEDVLSYKGYYAYNDTKKEITHGFHLDSIFNSNSAITSATTYVDGETGYCFDGVNAIQEGTYVKSPRIMSESNMKGCIYEDINYRKFTVYPFGGFDGWDPNRLSRTNTDDYNSLNYFASSAASYGSLERETEANLHLEANAINSDYYAYLGACNQYMNPNDNVINLFATPGINWYDNEMLVEDVLDMIESTEGRNGDALYIINTPSLDKESGDVLDCESVESLIDTVEIDSSYACTYYPWVKCYDENEKRYINLPTTKDVVRNMAETDTVSYPWFAAAGTSRGDVECEKACIKTTLNDEDILYYNSVNPVKSFKDGIKIWGNKTMYKADSPLNRINVRRLMLRVKKLVVDASKCLIFEQYDETLEKQFKGLVEPILSEVKNNRGIVDYRVITECTPETRDEHILPCKILIKPVPALEYISLSFVVYPESVSFEGEE